MTTNQVQEPAGDVYEPTNPLLEHLQHPIGAPALALRGNPTQPGMYARSTWSRWFGAMVWHPALCRWDRRLRTMVTIAANHTSHSDASLVALTRAERTGAIRAGWNDAAWDRPPRAMLDRLAPLYQLGYTGGLVFRRRSQQTQKSRSKETAASSRA